MAGPRQAPAPYDGMGTPTRWDAGTHDEGTSAERLDAARAGARSGPCNITELVRVEGVSGMRGSIRLDRHRSVC